PSPPDLARGPGPSRRLSRGLRVLRRGARGPLRSGRGGPLPRGRRRARGEDPPGFRGRGGRLLLDRPRPRAAHRTPAGGPRRRHRPNRIVAQHEPSTGGAGTPLLRGKPLVGGRAALYVCRGYACQRPVTDVAAVDAVLTSPAAAGTAHESAPAAIGESRMAG